jgi:hypothetical protein
MPMHLSASSYPYVSLSPLALSLSPVSLSLSTPPPPPSLSSITTKTAPRALITVQTPLKALSRLSQGSLKAP